MQARDVIVTQKEGTPHKHLLSVSDYYQMYKVGILKPSDRVELIKGELLTISPVGSHHATVVRNINRYFHQLLGDQAVMGIQDPIHLNDYSEPEPDVTLLAPPIHAYRERHPRPEEVWLLIEVCDTSYTADKQVKLPLYAEAAIPQVWLMNLPKHQIEVYTQPAKGTYKTLHRYFPEDTLTLSLQDSTWDIPLKALLI